MPDDTWLPASIAAVAASTPGTERSASVTPAASSRTRSSPVGVTTRSPVTVERNSPSMPSIAPWMRAGMKSSWA